MKGKAAVFLGAGKGYEVQEFDVPDPAPDAIVVRVAMAGICGSDLHIWRGDSPVFSMLANRVVGHEMMGRVHKLGSNIKTDSLGRPLNEGDRICYAYFYPCRRCYQCTRGEYAACPANALSIHDSPTPFSGAYGQYYYLKPNHWVFKVPDELPDEVVAPVNCALSQVAYGLQVAGLKFGDVYVAQGLGGLGLTSCAVAKDMGAGMVIGIDGVPARLEAARQFGAEVTININEVQTPDERVLQVMALTGNRGADVVGEYVGLPAVVQEGLRMVRNGGTYLEIGNISMGNTAPLDPSTLVWQSRRIVGLVQYQPWVIPQALDFLVRTREKYPFHKVMSHQYRLEDINRAFQEAEWQPKEGAGTSVTRALIAP